MTRSQSDALFGYADAGVQRKNFSPSVPQTNRQDRRVPSRTKKGILHGRVINEQQVDGHALIVLCLRRSRYWPALILLSALAEAGKAMACTAHFGAIFALMRLPQAFFGVFLTLSGKHS
jgi:hypothetical protein